MEVIEENLIREKSIKKIKVDTEKSKIWVKTYKSKKYKRIKRYQRFFCIVTKKTKEHCYIDLILNIEDKRKVKNACELALYGGISEGMKTGKGIEELNVSVQNRITKKLQIK